MKEGSLHLLTDGSILLDIVERPTASKISQGSEHQQLYRRCLFVVSFMTAPSVKQFTFGDRRYQLQEIGLWKTKSLSEFLRHGRFRFQHQKIADIRFVPQWILRQNNLQWAIFRVFPCKDTSGCAFLFRRGRGSSNHTVNAMSIQLTIHCNRRTPPKLSSRGLSVQPIFFNINGAVTGKASGQRHSRWRNSRCSGELGRGSGGGGGRRVHHLEDESRCVEGINLSDPHGAELSTQQKNQNMWAKYVEHIWKKNKLRIGSHIFRNLFLHHQFTQMIASKYKRYIQQFWRKKKCVHCKHRPNYINILFVYQVTTLFYYSFTDVSC